MTTHPHTVRQRAGFRSLTPGQLCFGLFSIFCLLLILLGVLSVLIFFCHCSFR